MEGNERKSRARNGWIVFGTLAVATAVEFLVSSLVASPILILSVIAVIKASLIIIYFMHLLQLWDRKAH